MLQHIFMNPEFNKRLEVLRRSGKKAVLAATKAEEIINRLQSGKVHPRCAGTITKYGEARIKGIMKFDLGSGYRLITFKQDADCYLLFAGTHDECHRWLENNREFDARQVHSRCEALPIQGEAINTNNNALDLPELAIMSREDGGPLHKIEEKDLRIIFSGLVESN